MSFYITYIQDIILTQLKILITITITMTTPNWPYYIHILNATNENNSMCCSNNYWQKRQKKTIIICGANINIFKIYLKLAVSFLLRFHQIWKPKANGFIKTPYMNVIFSRKKKTHFYWQKYIPWLYQYSNY